MDSFELSTDNFDPTQLNGIRRRSALQPDDDISSLLEDIPSGPKTVTPDDEIAPRRTRKKREPMSGPAKAITQPTLQNEPAVQATKTSSATQQAAPASETKHVNATASATDGSQTATVKMPQIALPSVNLKKMFSDSRIGIFFGVLLILAAAYMLVASISYIANSSADQSALVHSSMDMIKGRASTISNTTGWFGAMLSHFLIYRWLGLGSFVLIFYVGALGLNLVHLCNFKFWTLTFNSLVSAIAISLITGLLTYGSTSPTFFGGEHGHYINQFLIDNASLWGAVAVSIAMLTALILIFVKPLAYIFSNIGSGLSKIKEQMARRHDAAIEAARRTEIRQQAERAAEMAKMEAAKSTPATLTQTAKAAQSRPATSDANVTTASVKSSPSTEDIMPEPAEKPAPLDEIFSPLHHSPTISLATDNEPQNLSQPAPVEGSVNQEETLPFTSESPTEQIVDQFDDVVTLTKSVDTPPRLDNTLEEPFAEKRETETKTEPADTASIPSPVLGISSVLGPASLSLSSDFGPSISLDSSEKEESATVGIATERVTTHQEKPSEEKPSEEKPSETIPGSNALKLDVIPQTPIEIAEAEEIADSNAYDPTAELSHYKFPGLDLLRQIEDTSAPVDEEEQEANKQRIINILRSYGVEISSITATIGPTITLYEIVPAPGVRISKIKRLGDDVALSLSAMGIRIIAPIPGKGTIGMEVPNKKPRMVSMHSILASKAYRESKAQLPMALGTTISNEVYVTDLAKMPHLLVAGATGMGKSVGLNTIIASLLYRKHPAELKFVMVDPKRVEFSLYKCIERHYLAKLPEEDNAIITEPENVVATLNSLCKEMDDRYDLLSAAGVRGIKEYNEKFTSRRLNPEKGHRFLPYIVVVIDEFADLILTVGRDVETPISRLAAKARAIGIHVILATQRPSVNVITGVIKANFPGRIAFRVTQRNDSQTILDRPGAEQLIGRGDMLISRNGIIDRVQCAFIDTPEVEDICNFISAQQGYASAYELPEISTMSEGAASGSLTDRDPLFAEAGREVIGQGVGSTSSLQRKFNIGYPRAGKIMDQLEMAGVVGPTQGGKPRAVLMDMYSFERYLEV